MTGSQNQSLETLRGIVDTARSEMDEALKSKMGEAAEALNLYTEILAAAYMLHTDIPPDKATIVQDTRFTDKGLEIRVYLSTKEEQGIQ